jgi:GT2 family glycosyltransferase
MPSNPSNSPDPPDVSVVIVSYNTRDMLRNCLDSVFKQTQQARIQVIVVDNNSTDDSCAVVQQLFPEVTLIRNPDNRGFAAANNQGFRIATGRYLLLLNSDTVILDSAIDKTLAYMESHPEVGALGPKVLWPDREFQSTVFRFHSVTNVALDALYLPQLFPRLDRARYAGFDWDVEHNVDAAAGCFLLVRREVLGQVGVLDEAFFMYGEEAEWCHRMHKKGWRVVYYPGASIIHIFGGSSKGRRDSVRTQLAKRRAVLLFLHKAQGRGAAWLANAIMLLGLIPRLVAWTIADALKVTARRDATRADNRERLAVLRLHVLGLVRPVWRFDPSNTARGSGEPSPARETEANLSHP